MHETEDDLRRLQSLIERSYANAGSHLLSIHTPERRLDAGGVVARLQGMCLLTLATVTADGRPIVGPVDGVFYRGAFYFGSAPASARMRHLRHRPHVSAAHVPSEDLAITVHGTALRVGIDTDEHRGFRQTLLDIYVPRYGQEWEDFLDSGPIYARIDAARMFTFAWA